MFHPVRSFHIRQFITRILTMIDTSVYGRRNTLNMAAESGGEASAWKILNWGYNEIQIFISNMGCWRDTWAINGDDAEAPKPL